MICFSVFVLTFMSADFMITGSVTNTWIVMTILAGLLAAGIRKLIEMANDTLSDDREPEHRIERRT